MKKATLVLSDGRSFEGELIGSDGETTGEVCFNTGITGYQEILTDPSYCQQIVTMASPHIGNYGVNNQDKESDKVQVAGFILKEETIQPAPFLIALETNLLPSLFFPLIAKNKLFF